MLIADKLERLVEEMVEKGVRFEDAVREFEKRFIARVLERCDGSLTKTADSARHAPQHAGAEDGPSTRFEKAGEAAHPPPGLPRRPVSTLPLTLPAREL